MRKLVLMSSVAMCVFAALSCGGGGGGDNDGGESTGVDTGTDTGTDTGNNSTDWLAGGTAAM